MLKRRLFTRICLSVAVMLLGCSGSLTHLVAFGQERLCDNSFEDCRQPLWNLIKAENTEIDVAFWFMQDTSYANLIVGRFQAGVKVRVLVDPRANPSYPGNQQILNQLQQAGIPMRYKKADGILHWKMMLFAGQNTVEFSGADYSPNFFVNSQPYQNYIDEALYYSDDSNVVNSFKTKYDDLWTDTVNYANYANINGTLSRTYPTYPIDPDMNFPPSTANGPNDYGYRASTQMDNERQKIDAIMFRITSTIFSTASTNAVKRGVPMRLLAEPEEYRNPTRLWDSYNLDLMFMGGVKIKWTKHQGLNHEKVFMLYGQGMTVFGSSNWTGPSENYQQEHNYFTTKPWFLNWFINQFERKWNSQTEYMPFVPLPPDPPTNMSPANNATAQAKSLTLTWEGGYWGQKYDIYLGTSSTPPQIAKDVITGTPGPTQSETFTVSGLQPSTTYYWQIVGKTMANLTATGPVWSFTTGAATGTSAPTVASVSPNSGSMNGSTSITITGTNFLAGATVSVGNIAATSVSVVNPTTITAKTTAHFPGPADVTVTNSDGAAATLASGYTYTGTIPPVLPKISLIAPSTGVPAGGNSIEITGYGFSPTASVFIGGSPATNVTITNGVDITATAPAGTVGAADVQVLNPDGNSSTLSGGYTYAPAPPPPTASSISPNTGLSTGWTAITVTGSGFSYGATVTFGGTLGTNIIVVNSTTITAYTPAHSAGAVDVVVTNYDGQTSTLPAAFMYTGAAPAPSVSSVSPSSGPLAGGTSVTITGTNFVSGATVTFAGASATNVSVVSATSITAVTPANAAGSVTVVVTNPDNQSGSLPGGFTYANSSGENILLFDDFSSGTISTSKWSVNNLFSGTTDTTIPVAVVNQQLKIGPLPQNTSGSHYNGLRSATSYNFTGAYCYVELIQAPPSNTAADAMLTIGADVNDYYRIYVEAGSLICQKKVGGAKSNVFTGAYSASTEAFVRIRHDNTGGNVVFETAPDSGGGTPGSWTTLYSEPWNTSSVPLAGVIFEIKAGTFQAEANAPGSVIFDNFKAAIPAPAPTVSSVSPSQGPSSGGTQITISGTGFISGATVTVGGTAATSVSFGSANSLTATTPSHAAGAADVVVTNPDGQSGTLSGGFTYAASAAPTVSSVNPSSGTVSGGTSITITGTGFATGATVSLGGTAATNVVVSSSTSISAVTPAHAAGAADLTVTNPGGQSGTLPGGYTYVQNPAPTVSSVSPNSGSASGGTSVTITGTGFAAGASVTFGSAAATNVSVASSTSITAVTPANGSGAVNVVVTNTDGQSGTLTGGYTYTGTSGETVLLADDFSSGTINSSNWSKNLFSGLTSTSVPMQVVNQQLQIGPLPQNTAGSNYNGLRSVSTYNFTGAYCYIQLVQAPSSSTAADAMLTIGKDVNDYYRIYVEAGSLICQKKIGSTKANMFTGAYNSTNEQYLRIRHDSTSGNVVFEVAPNNSGAPGTWTMLYSEAWNTASIPLSSIIFEMKAGTWQAETSAPGPVIFDNFRAALPTAPTGPTVTSISPSSGPIAGGTPVTISGTGFAGGASVTIGGTSATNVVVNSSSSISANTPAHVAGAADVVVINPGGQSSTLSGGFTYTQSAPAPTVSSVSPNSGSASGGTSVTITGTGFGAGASVTFGSAAATNVSVTSSTSITSVTPANGSGAVNVVVTNTDGQSGTLTGGYTYTGTSGETVLLADDFSSGTINSSNWSNNLFSGFTSTSVPMQVVNQQLQIGPLPQNTAGSNYNGLRSVSTYNFTGAYCYIQLVQAPSSSTAADAMLTIGKDVNDYYRIYVEAGSLICQKKIGSTKANMFTGAYNATNEQYLRIRHDSTSGNVVFEVAPDNSGAPGTWTMLYSEAWNTASIPLSSIIFEMKAGTWQAETSAPGPVIFDNFRAAIP